MAPMLPDVMAFLVRVGGRLAVAGGLLLAGAGCGPEPGRTPDVARPPEREAGGRTEVEVVVPEPEAPPRPRWELDTAEVGAYFDRYALLREHRGDAQLFYVARRGQLGWFRKGKLLPHAHKLLERLEETEEEGLDPRRYRKAALEKQLAALDTAQRGRQTDSVRLADVMRETDLALTGTYFLLLGDHFKGAVSPHVNSAVAWSKRREQIRLHRSLAMTLAQRNPTLEFNKFGARHQEYERLRATLKALRELQKKGGWGTVPARKKRLEPGQRDSVFVPALRRRLRREREAMKEAVPELVQAAESTAEAALASRADTAGKDTLLTGPVLPQPGSVVTAGADPAVYDDRLVAAVKDFQERHGLKADGVVGKGTIAALQVPLRRRITQIVLNMERWRWVPQKKSRDYIWVNIPEFRLHVIEEGREVMGMKVIVGKRMKATPLFSDKLKYIVLAPYWNVPNSIVMEEIRPGMLRNRKYLEKEEMEVVSGKQVVDAKAIDWVKLDSTTLWRYRIRQRSGPKNPLGPIKFILPNDNDVYLHGTPNQWMFSKQGRTFSHGCVRVEDPYGLANYLLRSQPEWNDAAIRAAVADGEETWIVLKKALPVYLVYFTAWVNEKGGLCFRDDIYGHDGTLAREYFRRGN